MTSGSNILLALNFHEFLPLFLDGHFLHGFSVAKIGIGIEVSPFKLSSLRAAYNIIAFFDFVQAVFNYSIEENPLF